MKKKSRPNKDVAYTTAKEIRKKIFKYKLLPQEECLVLFKEMDGILLSSVGTLVTANLLYVEEYFKDLILRVASGNTQSKNFFEKNDHEDDSKKKTKVLWNSESRFLKTAFNLLRPNLPIESKMEIIAKSRFMRGVLEDAVSFFIERVERFKAGEKILLSSLGCYDETELEALYVVIKPQWERFKALKQQLVEPYLRLVYKKAKQNSASNSQTLDNFQNGYDGLIRAIRQYTPTRFAVFSLVAQTWISQAILIRLKNEVNFIKLPVGVWNNYHKLENFRKELGRANPEHVTNEQLSVVSGMDLQKIKRTYESIKLTKTFSLDVPTSNEEEQGGGASWNKESIEAQENIQEQLEIQSEFKVVESLVAEFPDETRLIFGLTTGCINLISDPDFTREELERETLLQRMASYNVEVIV